LFISVYSYNIAVTKLFIMTYTKKQLPAEVASIETYPMYFSYSEWQFAKAVAPGFVIYVVCPAASDTCAMEIRSHISTGYEPMDTPELFYESAARAMQRLSDGCDIVPLQLEGGAYAD
jgi:hypothetical protein